MTRGSEYGEKSVLIEGDNETGKIITGDSLLILPDSQLLKYGHQISRALTEHHVTMLQYSPDKLIEIMHDKRAVVVVDPINQDRCWAFAQISPWTGTDDNGEDVVKTVEFRSWKSWQRDQGKIALKGAVQLSAVRYPGIPLYAVVEASNIKAQSILMMAGAEIVPMPSSMKVELIAGEKEAQVVTFNLSRIRE